MKTIRTPFLVMVLMAMAIISQGCTSHEMRDNARQQLLDEVSALNSKCPIEMGLATCVGVDIRDSEVIFKYEIDEQSMNLSIFDQKPQQAKRAMGSLVFGDNPELAELLLKADYSFRADYKGSKSKRIRSVKLTLDEIQQISENPLSQDEQIDWQVELANASCPQDIGDGLAIVQVKHTGDDVAYICDFDEEELDIDILKQNVAEMKLNMLQAMDEEIKNDENPVEVKFYKMLINAGKNISYVYRGKDSGKSVTVTLENAKLQELLNE